MGTISSCFVPLVGIAGIGLILKKELVLMRRCQARPFPKHPRKQCRGPAVVNSVFCDKHFFRELMA